MQTIFRRAVVIFPESPAIPRIEEMRARFDPLAGMISGHITLVFPFESAISTAMLEKHLRSSIATMAPFSIALRGVSGSEGEYIFLNVTRGHDELVALHDRLYGGQLAPFLSLEQTYVPHLTVGRIADPLAYSVALPEAQGMAETVGTVEAEVRAISSYLISPDGSRGIECSVML